MTKSLFWFSIIIFSLLASIPLVSATLYLDVFAKGLIQPGRNVTISGTITNSSASDTVSGINVSALITGGDNGSQVTGSGGTFNFNITAPSAVGEYNVSVSTNKSTLPTKTIPIYVSNVTMGGSVVYTGKFPPFANGTEFTFNVSLMNGSSYVSNYYPNVSVYMANGPQMSWVIENLSAASGSNGIIQFNITIPSSASPGFYAIVVDHGAIFNVFEVRSGYMIAVNTETGSAEVSSNFAPSSQVMILAKVRKTTGDPATGVSYATALVTLPNGTVRSFNLTARDQDTYPGFFNSTFNESSASGQYGVLVKVYVAGSLIEASTIFKTETFTFSLTTGGMGEFFHEWGGQAAFPANGTISLNILPVNLSTDELIASGSGANPMWGCNSTYLKLVDVYYPNGTSINSTILSAAFSSSQYMMSQICKIQFLNVTISGTYGVKVNVTLNEITETAEGYFSIQKYLLKASPVSGLGGEKDFTSMSAPGDNVTLSLTAYNLSNEQQLSGTDITNIVPLKAIPLEFSTGSNEITTLNYTATTGSDPQVVVTIPSSVMGPTLVKVQATVAGETVVGDAFFMTNYLMGMLGPSSGEGGSGGGGPPVSSCSGTVTFSGIVNDVKTGTAAQGVGVSGFIQAREEMTGRDIRSYLTITGSTASNSQGQIIVNVSFNPPAGYSFSGFYFMALNASYKGNSAGIPAGFMCKNLNFWTTTKAVGSQSDSWQMAPSSAIVVTIINVTRVNDSTNIGNQSQLSFPGLMNFNPSKGGQKILLPTSSFMSNLTNGLGNFTASFAGGIVISNNISITLYPQNFTIGGSALSQWPNGFIEMDPRICSPEIGGSCDMGFGGFQIVPYDSWIDGWQWGGTSSAGEIKSYLINVRTNVSAGGCTNTLCDSLANQTYISSYTGSNNLGNNTGFSVTIGRPWEGSLTLVTDVNITKLHDGWNNSQNTGQNFERWNVTFSIPPTIKKGDAELTININNSQGEETVLSLFTSITKFSVIIPSEDGVGGSGTNFDDYWLLVDSHEGNPSNPEYAQRNVTSYGWNVTNLALSYGVNSTGGRVCIKNRFNATRQGQQQQQIDYSYTNYKMMIIDRNSPATFDTVVLNNSVTGQIVILNATQRNVTVPNGQGGFYFWNIEDCGYVKFINTSASAIYGSTNTWGGNYQNSTSFYVPYVVQLSNAPVAGANMYVNSVGKQDDRGFGFEVKYPYGQNWTSANATTDLNGVAFVRLNVAPSGRMVGFWKVNRTVGGTTDEDLATMSTATFFEIKQFRTMGNTLYELPQGYVTLQYVNNSNSYLSAFDSVAEPYVYGANVTETSANGFLRDGSSTTIYIVYAPRLNATKIGNFTAAPDISLSNRMWTNINYSYNMGGNVQLAVGTFIGNTSSTGPIVFYYFQDSPTRNGPIVVSSATENVTVSICAQGFEKPNSIPYEGATAVLTTMQYSPNGPPQTKTLQMYSLLNQSAISSVTFGPKGCAAVRVGPGELNAWPTNTPVFIQGTVTYGNAQEAVYVTDVFRAG